VGTLTRKRESSQDERHYSNEGAEKRRGARQISIIDGTQNEQGWETNRNLRFKETHSGERRPKTFNFLGMERKSMTAEGPGEFDQTVEE